MLFPNQFFSAPLNICVLWFFFWIGFNLIFLCSLCSIFFPELILTWFFLIKGLIGCFPYHSLWLAISIMNNLYVFFIDMRNFHSHEVFLVILAFLLPLSRERPAVCHQPECAGSEHGIPPALEQPGQPGWCELQRAVPAVSSASPASCSPISWLLQGFPGLKMKYWWLGVLMGAWMAHCC